MLAAGPPPPQAPAAAPTPGTRAVASVAAAASSHDGGGGALPLRPQMSWPPGAVRLEGWGYKGTRLSDALVVRRWLRLAAGGRLASCRSRGGSGSGGANGSGAGGGGGGGEFSPAAETRAWQLHRGCRLEPELWPADVDASQESDQQLQQQQQLPPPPPPQHSSSSGGGGGGGGGGGAGGSPSQLQVPTPQRKVERPRGRWTVTAKVTGGDPVDLVSGPTNERARGGGRG